MSAPTSATDPFGRESSGDTSFRMTTKDLITEALAICKIGIEGERLANERLTNGRRTLNIMCSGWQRQGIHLWTYEEGTLFTETNKSAYTLEQVHATNHYTKTKLSADALTAATTVTIDTNVLGIGQEQVDYVDTDWYIGFLLADNTLWWTTVVSAVDTAITLTDGLPEDLLTGCYVVFYRDKVRSVERTLNYRRVENLFSDGFMNETPIKQESHKGYFNQPNKSSTGPASLAYYHRELPQGTLHVWPAPGDSLQPLNFTYERMIEDFVNDDDCADWPKYWYEAIVYNLADRLATKYRVPPQLKAEIKENAMMFLEETLNFDDENADFSVSVFGEI